MGQKVPQMVKLESDGAAPRRYQSGNVLVTAQTLRTAFLSTTGLSLIDVAVGITLTGTIVLGVLACMSGAFLGSRTAAAGLERQLLLERVLEEVQALPFSKLPSLDGTSVDEGTHHAEIEVQAEGAGLAKVEVVVTSESSATDTSRGVLLVASRE
jgi:hypothetical protein